MTLSERLQNPLSMSQFSRERDLTRQALEDRSLGGEALANVHMNALCMAIMLENIALRMQAGETTIQADELLEMVELNNAVLDSANGTDMQSDQAQAA